MDTIRKKRTKIFFVFIFWVVFVFCKLSPLYLIFDSYMYLFSVMWFLVCLGT